MKKKSGSVKVSKIVALVLILVLVAMASTACAEKKITYLNEEQNKTLSSARPVPGTNNQAYEINYTADYKMDEFIKTITENMLYHTTDCRMTMKKLLADGSGVDPLDRLTNDVPGCSSVVCRNSEGVPVIGRNYDLDIRSNGATVVIHTAPKDGYKSVGVADCGQTGLSVDDLKNGTAKKELLLYAPYYTMDGVNEKGFACSIMLLNEGRCIQETGKDWLPSTLVVRYLLDYADSVDHAIELLNEMDLRSDYFVDPVWSEAFGLSFHWALTDASGNKAVIEYVDGKLVVNQYPLKVEYNEDDDSMKVSYPKEEKGYLLSTNFYVTEGFNNTAHDSGRWRYETLEKAMSENPTPTNDQLKDIMKSAKYFMNDRDYMFELREQGTDTTNPDNWDWITIWTDILNTSEKSLTLWMRENYEVENTFKLEY